MVSQIISNKLKKNLKNFKNFIDQKTVGDNSNKCQQKSKISKIPILIKKINKSAPMSSKTNVDEVSKQNSKKWTSSNS